MFNWICKTEIESEINKHKTELGLRTEILTELRTEIQTELKTELKTKLKTERKRYR